MKSAIQLVFFLMVGGTVIAQMSSDPNHEVYHYFEEWETKGYVSQVPPIRPFPGQVVESLLRQVVKNGDAHAQEMAGRFLRPYDSGKIMNWKVTGEHTSAYRVNDTYGWTLGGGASAEGRFHPLIYYSADFRLVLLDKDTPLLTPLLERSDSDVVIDNFGFSAGGIDFSTLWQAKSSASIGNDTAYLQTGVMRHSFGPFHDDSAVMSSSSTYSGSLLVHWRGKIASYTGGLFIMAAPQIFKNSEGNAQTDVYTLEEIAVAAPANTNALGGNTIYNGVQTGFYQQYLVPTRRTAPGKYLFLQMLSFYITPWMELALFETTLFGPNFDFRYLIPFKLLIHLQNIGGFPHNTYIGLYLDTRVGKEWKISTLLYVDDFDASDFIQFNWEKMKAKLAFQAGVKWAPRKSVVSYISLDYLLVTPYMYTHWNEKGTYLDEPNYANYMNGLDPIGANLDPNSDRLTLNIQLRFGKGFEMDILGRFSQHGDASAGYITHMDGISGTVWDSGYTSAMDGNNNALVFDEYNPVDGPQPTFQDRVGFLSQSILQRIFQFGLTLRYSTYAVKKSHIFAELGYTGEYTLNKNLVKDNNTFENYLYLGLRYSFLP